MWVHVLVLSVEKYLRTIAVNVIKVLNSALDAIKSYLKYLPHGHAVSMGPKAQRCSCHQVAGETQLTSSHDFHCNWQLFQQFAGTIQGYSFFHTSIKDT